MAEWNDIVNSPEYTAEQTALRRTTNDFVFGIRAAWVAFTRYPESDEWLLQRSTDDLLESALGVYSLARDGIHNMGRRELRYLLEAVVKHVFVDQQLPGDASLETRLAYLDDSRNVPRSSVEPVDRLTVRLQSEPKTLTNAVHSAFGSLSAYTHLSKQQLDERLRRAERGEYIGFEGAMTLRSFNKLLVQTYDVVLALIFEGIGAAFTGDVFIQVLDHEERWRFHKTKFVAEISQFFNYKAERQHRNGSQ